MNILTAIFEVFLICSVSWSLRMRVLRMKIGMNKYPRRLWMQIACRNERKGVTRKE